MGRRKLAVFAVIFSLFSLSSVYAVEAKGAVKQHQYAKIVKEAESPEELAQEYQDLTAQIGFEAWIANSEMMTVPYKILENAVLPETG